MDGCAGDANHTGTTDTVYFGQGRCERLQCVPSLHSITCCNASNVMSRYLTSRQLQCCLTNATRMCCATYWALSRPSGSLFLHVLLHRSSGQEQLGLCVVYQCRLAASTCQHTAMAQRVTACNHSGVVCALRTRLQGPHPTRSSHCPTQHTALPCDEFLLFLPCTFNHNGAGKEGAYQWGGKGGSRARLGLRARGGCQGMTCSADLGQEGYAVKKRMRSMKMCFVRVHGREWGVPYPFQIAKPSPGYLDCSLVLI